MKRLGDTTIEWHSDSPEQTCRIAMSLAHNLRAGDVVALEGDLGAGKTCFVRGLAQGLGLDPSLVSSPTFVIAHEYAGPPPASITLAHVDAYRLRGPDELESIGWSELLTSDDVIVAVEWPQRIAAALPRERIEVRLQAESDTRRLIRISAAESLIDRLQEVCDEPHGNTPDVVACRSCGHHVEKDIKTFPFCSERCRLADLGAWFREGYRMTRPVERDEEISE